MVRTRRRHTAAIAITAIAAAAADAASGDGDALAVTVRARAVERAIREGLSQHSNSAAAWECWWVRRKQRTEPVVPTDRAESGWRRMGVCWRPVGLSTIAFREARCR